MHKVYLDENGDNGLDFDKQGTRRYFIITGVIVEDIKEETIINGIDDIANKFLQGGPIKSRKITNHEKRQSILNQILKLDLRIISFIVDKTYLEEMSPGYSFKSTFYKNIPNKLYSYLKKLFTNAEIIPDPVGSPEFQEELKRYVLKENPLKLFQEDDFYFGSANDNRITQIADLVSGSVSRSFETEHNYLELLKSKIVIKPWPISTNAHPAYFNEIKDEHDKVIAESAFNLARDFIARKSDSQDHVLIDQCRLLELLIFEIINGNSKKYIPLHVLLQNLAENRNVTKLGGYYFRTKVVGKLRSSDVMIVSNKKGGYKLPISLSDVNDFLVNLNDKVQPMVVRAGKLRDHIRIRTGFDILANNEFRFLRNYSEIKDLENYYSESDEK